MFIITLTPTQSQIPVPRQTVFNIISLGMDIGWLVGWLFNGTSTQNGQFVPPAGTETGSVK